MGVHLSIKAKLVLAASAAQELKSTMEEFNRACNTLSELAFQRDLHRKYDIHHEGYRLIRQETNLPAQHVINAIAKVSAVYTRDSNKWHRFKPHSSVRPEVEQPQGSLGVDLGFNRVAVTSNNKFHTAKNIRHKKSCYKRTRRSLQANGGKSAKRALKRVSGRERRFVADTNHCVSKQIVADAKANNQRIVLEDLNGIRETGKAKCVHEWSFAELQQMIRYKAAWAGVEVVTVSPRYTSQTCSRCLHLLITLRFPDQQEKRLVGHILGRLLRPQHPVGKPVHAIAVTLIELTESRLVAARGLGQQFLICE